jgi:hypothetical protein
LGFTVPNAAQDGHQVRLELHSGTPAEAEPTPRQSVSDVAAGDRDVSRQSFQDCHQRRTVRLPGREPSEHDQQSSM